MGPSFGTIRGLTILVPDIDGFYRGPDDILQRFYKPAIASAANIGKGLFATGHISINMQIDVEGDDATALAYFFEIVANSTMLIGSYQHRLCRDANRWRFKFLRNSVRYPPDSRSHGSAGRTFRTSSQDQHDTMKRMIPRSFRCAAALLAARRSYVSE